MAAAEPVHGFGEPAVALAAALGLDPDRTVAFTITVPCDDLITVRAEQYTTVDAIESVSRIFADLKAEGREPVRRGTERLIPAARLADLAARAAVGALTNAEQLALAVLKGGPVAERSVDQLIDAAQEEFASGCYRVPVRVVADKKRLKMVVTPPGHLTSDGGRRTSEDLRAWIEKPGASVLVFPGPGWTVEAFEVGDGGEVELSEPVTPE